MTRDTDDGTPVRTALAAADVREGPWTTGRRQPSTAASESRSVSDPEDRA